MYLLPKFDTKPIHLIKMTDVLAGQKVCYLEEAEVQIVAKKSTTHGK